MRGDLAFAVMGAAALVVTGLVALSLPGGEPHHGVKLAPRAGLQPLAAAAVVVAHAAAPPVALHAAGRQSSQEKEIAGEALAVEGHAAGDDPDAKYAFREEEGTLRRFAVVQDPGLALSPFGGAR